MSRRITITVHDDNPDETAVRLVRRIIRRGKISHNTKGDYYCWATICNTPEGEFAVYTSCRCTPPNVAFHVMKA